MTPAEAIGAVIGDLYGLLLALSVLDELELP